MGWLCTTTRGTFVTGNGGPLKDRTHEKTPAETFADALDWLERQGREYAATAENHDLDRLLSMVEQKRTLPPSDTFHFERLGEGNVIVWSVIPDEPEPDAPVEAPYSL